MLNLSVGADGRTKKISKCMIKMRNALLEMLETESLDDIVVTTLCERCGVNRMTFYRYYNSKYALLEDVVSGICDNIWQSVVKDKEFEQGILGRQFMDENKFACEIISKLVSAFDANFQQIKMIYKSNNIVAINIVNKSVNKLILRMCAICKSMKISGMPITYISATISGALCGIFSYRLEQNEDEKLSSAEFVRYICTMAHVYKENSIAF